MMTNKTKMVLITFQAIARKSIHKKDTIIILGSFYINKLNLKLLLNTVLIVSVLFSTEGGGNEGRTFC